MAFERHNATFVPPTLFFGSTEFESNLPRNADRLTTSYLALKDY